MPAKRKHINRRRQKLLRLLAKISLVVLAVAVTAFLIYRFIVRPLRAQDLAAKALASIDSGNYRMAWLQISSARQLGPTDPSVLRAAAIFEGKLGRRESLELWEQVARQASLDNNDRASRAVAAMLFGTDEQCHASLEELESAGENIQAEALRISRLSTRGNLSLAIAEAKRASASTNDPGLKLGYTKLLLRYHAVAGEGPTPPQSIAAFKEMAALVDELQATPEARNALAFGLDYLKVPEDVRRRWIGAALADVSPENPALLPAAEAAVHNGYFTAATLHAKLGPVYDKASLDHRCAYSLWLSAQGMPREAVSLITPVEGTGDPVAFAARAAGLAGLGNWPAIVAAADSATGPPESVRVLSRARAEIAIGGSPKALSSMRLGLQAAAREGRLPAAVGMVDNLEGGPAAVDEQLVQLSGQPGTADLVFRMLRARWSRSKGTDALLPAYAAASQASPDAPSVRDFGRYLALIAQVADEEDENEITFDDAATREALAADPGDINARITRALHLLRQNQPDEAHAVFDDITVFFETLPPGQQAVIAAINQARGQRELARAMLANIDTSVLNAGERDLVREIAAESAAK
jgi:hypothetical protein